MATTHHTCVAAYNALFQHDYNLKTVSRPSKTPHKHDRNTEAAQTNVPQLKRLVGVGDGEWMAWSGHSS
jgi:hypothetical protein